MEPRITLLTIGVDNLERALTFYRDGLGLPTKGIVGQEIEHGAVVFFELQGGLRLALWERRNIAHDAGLPQSGRGPTEFTIAHNVRTRTDVDAVMAQAAAAGAKIVKPAGETFWGGYTGYFFDPDEHLWRWRGIPRCCPKVAKPNKALEKRSVSVSPGSPAGASCRAMST